MNVKSNYFSGSVVQDIPGTQKTSVVVRVEIEENKIGFENRITEHQVTVTTSLMGGHWIESLAGQEHLDIFLRGVESGVVMAGGRFERPE